MLVLINSLFLINHLVLHGDCYIWNSDLVWLFVGFDLLIALACYSISLILLHFARQQRDVAFNWGFLLFGISTLACGTAYLMAAWVLWHPASWLSEYTSAITTIASASTVVLLVMLVLKVLALQGAAQLKAANVALRTEATKRQQLELALFRLKTQTELILNCAGEGIYGLDVRGNTTFVNPAAARMLGWESKELIGQPKHALIHHSHADGSPYPEQECPIYAAFRDGLVHHVDDEVFWRKDGTSFPVEYVSTPMREDGNLVGAVVVFRDITERKQQQQALLEKQEHLELAQAAAKLGSFEWNIQTGEIAWSHQLEALYGLKPSTFGGTYRDWARCVHPEDLLQAEADVQASLVCGSFFTDFRALWPDGSIRWLHARAKVFFNGDGQPLRMVGVNVDITTRKMAEEALQQTKNQLEYLVQQRTSQWQTALQFEAMLKRISDKLRDCLDESQILQTAVQELTLVLSVSCCNTALYDLEQGFSRICYEYAIANGGAQACTISIVDSPQYQQLLQRQSCQFCSLTPNPRRGRVAMLAAPIFDDHSVLGDLWLIDRPERVFNEFEIQLVQQVATQCAIALRQARLYTEVKAQVEELERLNCIKDDFLNTVSHELRTPMASIKMATSMLEVVLQQSGFLDGEPNRARQYLQILRSSCDRESKLIDNLLDLSRLERETEPLNLTIVELSAWIPSIVEPFVEPLHARHQTLEINIPHGLPTLTTDAAKLERIVVELLHNACKYTPDGEQIVLSAAASYSRMQLLVSNCGVEIPLGERERIFDKFYRIPQTDPWKYSGTGLGLALVKQLVVQLGGTISVDSAKGWTTFCVELLIELNPEAM